MRSPSDKIHGFWYPGKEEEEEEGEKKEEENEKSDICNVCEELVILIDRIKDGSSLEDVAIQFPTTFVRHAYGLMKYHQIIVDGKESKWKQ